MIPVPAHLDHVATYTPGQSPDEVQRQFGLTHVVKLASNENPFGPSPLGIAAAQRALTDAHIYNDGGLALRHALAEHHGRTIHEITVHNGSDAIIHQIMRTFLQPGDNAVSCAGGFISFSIAVKSHGHEAILVPLTAEYRFDVAALAAAVNDRTRVVYVPNPNNPTGTYLNTGELTWLIDNVPTSVLVVVDEAYHEFAMALAPGEYPDATLLGRPNVISLRTFSKAYGLAALRIGYAVGHPDVIHWLLKTKLPFDPNGPGCAAAIAALQDTEYVRRTIDQNTAALAQLEATARECGLRTAKSVTNFIMIDCGSPTAAHDLHHHLLVNGFITRPLRGFGLPNCVRISTGLPEHMTALCSALSAFSFNEATV
jgi:histidinol-phosphate aminotransferase